MQRVYLCLAQGTTEVREEFGAKAVDALVRFAGIMRDRVPEAWKRFSLAPIELLGSSLLA